MINLDLKLNNDSIKQILENDYIDRNRYLNKLIIMLNNFEENEIIALDGDWGSGKTFFLKSLEYLMNNDYSSIFKNIDFQELEKLKGKYMVFYYNAWENDDASSATLSLIYKLVNDTCLKEEQNKESYIPNILNAIVKAKTNGYIDLKELSDKKWTNKELTESIKTTEEIKEKFTELITNLIAEKKEKLLIIIDEIDRCKPLFAIDLLENIKHFYEDDRVVFIVGTNNKQLGASVCKVYGESYDGYAYLDKFFSRNLELPNNYLDNYILAVDENKIGSDYGSVSFREIAKLKNLSMRNYNHYFKTMESIKSYLKEYHFDRGYNIFINYIFVPLAMCLKIQEKSKYYKFINGELFEEISFIMDNSDEIYYIIQDVIKNINRDSLKDEDGNILDKDKMKVIIVEKIKEIYFNLSFSNNGESSRVKTLFSDALDILSMMN